MLTDKMGLGYKSKMKYNSNKNMIELQLENLTYEESLYLYHPLKSNDDSTFDKLLPNYLFNNDISINMIQIEQINIENIKPIYMQSKVKVTSTLIENNIREVEEYDLSDKTWILVPNQLEEGSHIVIEETIDINISDDSTKPKITQLGKYLTKEKNVIYIYFEIKIGHICMDI